MVISSIQLQNFRSYTDAEYSFDAQTTIITGKNGVGKTNLLEAIYVLLQGGSFRALDRDLLRYESEWWRLDGVIDGRQRQVRYQTHKTPSKQIIINEKAKRFSFADKCPVVLFEPNDLLFVSGSPSRRRSVVDSMLSQLSHDYKTMITRYERIVLQRNNALKQHHRHHLEQQLRDMLFVWDVSLARYAEKIGAERAAFIERINTLLPFYYAQISGETHDVLLRDDCSLSRALNQSAIMEFFERNIQRDIERRTTNTGPHRDDFTFILSNNDAKISASRGENRSLLLSLKLAYRDIVAQKFETQPLLLLDDVFSELDETRQKNLLSIARENQIVITDTHADTELYSITLQSVT